MESGATVAMATEDSDDRSVSGGADGSVRDGGSKGDSCRSKQVKAVSGSEGGRVGNFGLSAATRESA